MYINQNKVIFSRNGMSLLASLSGTSQSLPLSDADFVVLGKLCNGLNIANQSRLEALYAEVLSDPVIKAGFPSLNIGAINRRLDEYANVKALTPHQTDNPPVINPVEVDSIYKPSMLHKNKNDESDSELRLTTHFALSLSANGMCVWSTTANEFLRVDAIDAIIMCAFAQGKKLSQVIQEKTSLQLDKDELLKRISLWRQANVLVAQQIEVIQNAQELKPFSTSTTDNRAETDWQHIDSENHKIPIYFVPHMENHLPLALGVLFASIEHYDDGRLLDRFQLIPLNYMSPNEFIRGPYRKFGAGIWLFSNYMWSIDVNLQISQAIKNHNSQNITIHGGPSTPDYKGACEEFMAEHKSVDIAVHGEGEVTINEILDVINRQESDALVVDYFKLSKVNGLSYRDKLSQKTMRTPSRERMKEPDLVPSPYLTGVFDGYKGRVEAAIIETNRGCPYGCTFCDWGSATNQKIRKFDLERVKQEIEWVGKNQVRVLWIADANYGLYDRDIEISKHIVDTKKKFGFPQEIVVNYTKNSTWRLVEIIKLFSEGGIIGQGIISIQTTDEKTLEVINRKNIRTKRYDELTQAFTDLNLPLSTDLMIGLPGMTVDSFLNDLQRYIDMDVSVKAYPTQLLPNSPMADPEYMQKYQIKTDEHSYLTSTYSYSKKDLERMMALNEIYMMAEGYGLLRYIMRFLQWEYGIKAKQVLSDLFDLTQVSPDKFPLITWAVRFFNKDKSMPAGWYRFYEQIKDFVNTQYSGIDNKSLETVIAVNRQAMPDDACRYPVEQQLDFDFSAYFTHNKNDAENVKPLKTYAPSSILFSDPNNLSIVDLEKTQYDSHQYFYELHSPISRPKSIS